jgi:hypothetical protein
MKTQFSLGLFLVLFSFANLNAQFFRSKENFADFHSKYEILDFDFNALYKNIDQQTDGIVTLELGQYGVFKCQVSASNLLMNQAESFIQKGNQRIVLPRSKENQWKGKVYGSSKLLRLNVYSNCLSGMIALDSGALCFETFMDEGKPRLIVYSSLHNIAQNKGPFCTVDEVSLKAPIISNKRAFEYVDYTCRIYKIGCVASYRLLVKNKYDTTATFNEVRDVLNITDGTYSQYAGIRVRMAFESISYDSTAVINTSNSMLDRIGDMKARLSQFSGKLIPDVVHLFAESFAPYVNDQSIGRAYLGSACKPDINTSTSQAYFGSLAIWADVLSHELGHNLGAEHIHGSNCSGYGSVMCPGVQGLPTFINATELNVMRQYISNVDEQVSFKITPNCLEYPVSLNVSDINLNGRDSVLVQINLDKDFHASRHKLYGSNQSMDVSYKKELWIKSPGYNYLIYDLDTVNGFTCRYENEFFVANNDFVVRNTNVNGVGSLGNAILNSNNVPGMDTIIFALPNKENVIEIDSVLPLIYDSVLVDGYTQKGYERMTATKAYRPAVTLRNKLPLPFNSDQVCFLLGRKQYGFQGLNFEDFYYGIKAHFGDLNYIPKYKSLYLNFKDSNYTAIYEAKGNKFVNNVMGFYVTSFELNNSSDRIVLGGDSLYDGNVFLNSKGTCARIAYSKSATIKNNLFGFEPGIDTFKTFQAGLTFNGGSNVIISNNAFGRFAYSGIEAANCDGEIMNNTFGQNIFTKQIAYFSGKGLQTIGWSTVGMLKIGDTLSGKGNVFFGKKNTAAISFSSSSNTYAQGNLVYSTDTASIVADGKYSPKAYKAIELDSVAYSCAKGNVFTVHGSVTAGIANDTMDLYFYAVPKGVKNKREPIHRYLGFKQIICSDTFGTKFTLSIPNAKYNEGILCIGNSQKRKQTGINSNAVYPKNTNPEPVQISKDTCVCPQQMVQLNFDASVVSAKLNGKTISKPYSVSKPGVYDIETIDSKNCAGGKTLVLNNYPNYLHGVQLMGDSFYTKNVQSTYYLEPFNMMGYWKTFAWSAANSILGISLKLNTDITFFTDSSILYYSITDANKCAYNISRNLSRKRLSDLNSEQYGFSNNVYPNPIKMQGRLFFEEPVSGLIQIYDAFGQKVFEQNASIEGVSFIELDLKTAGLYWIKLGREGVYGLMVE